MKDPAPVCQSAGVRSDKQLHAAAFGRWNRRRPNHSKTAAAPYGIARPFVRFYTVRYIFPHMTRDSRNARFIQFGYKTMMTFSLCAPFFKGFGVLFLSQRAFPEERKIAGVGIDTHGVDPGQDETYATNVQVSAQQGIILECLAHVDQLPATGSTLVVGILRLQGGSGSPASVMAFIP